MVRAALVTATSLALTGAVVAHAYFLKHQFYPTVVYLTKSSPSMAVLYIQAFVLVFLLGKFMRKVFFGQLRAAEMEHLIERSWYAVTETCLAFTVFRDDFSPRFVALFTLLLFLKCFHWLAEDRVDFVSDDRETTFSTCTIPCILPSLSLYTVHCLKVAGKHGTGWGRWCVDKATCQS
uniref:E3 ubiquitin-protein ligase synoviolin-like TPR repeats domain-containing protein n=1 Tax=Seriola lalandi dorsalis TaxID=1841481 RepID=A0A3B4WHI1_SERLL